MSLENKNFKNLLDNTIAKEMCFFRIAFDIRGKRDTSPSGHQFIKCHIIFDVRMEDLQRKARMVAGGHITDMQPDITYASTVFHETMRIG